MDPSIYRAYTIRGVAGESLTADDMAAIGRAAGTLLGEVGISVVVLGRDYRLSSPELAAALREGLLASGMDAIDLGLCPTPLLNWATDHLGAGAGLMVTASHNPPAHNGLKIRTDHTLGGEELVQIYRVAVERRFRQGQGALSHTDPAEAYLDAICARARMGRPLRLVVDAGNGAAGPLAPRLLARLGCQVVPLYCEPDGRFPNRPPDPGAPGALDALAARVRAEGADAGLAYDGDGDRLAMVDEQGRAAYADRLLALLAREALAAHPGAAVVYELSCTQALPETVARHGGRPIACPVGYAFVHQAMRETGAVLGGESAGHIFFADPAFRFDDALLASATMAALLSRVGAPFSALLAELPYYCRSPEHRLPCPEGRKGEVVDRVRASFEHRGYAVDRMDGARVHFSCGWGLFRASNTQPAVALRCEARTPEALAEIEGQMLEAVHEALGDAAGP